MSDKKLSRQDDESNNIWVDYYFDLLTGDLTKIDYSHESDVDFFHDRLGRLAEVKVGGVTTNAYTYDDDSEDSLLHLVDETVTIIDGVLDPDPTATITRKYETSGVAGRFIGIDAETSIESSAYDVDYGYDATTGRLDEVSGTGLVILSNPTPVQYSFVANSDLVDETKYRVDGGMVFCETDLDYESNRNLLTVVDHWKYGVGSYAKYTYTYDPLGRRDSVLMEGSSVFSQTHNMQYTYNDRSELDQADRNQGTGSTPMTTDYLFDYHNDHIGNREDVTIDTASTYYCANNLNQYDKTSGSDDCPTPTSPIDTFGYDEDGNLIEDDDFKYTWDSENRLTNIDPVGTPDTGDKRVTFAYDYMGRRIRKLVEVYNGSSWDIDEDFYFVYEPLKWNVLLVLDATDGSDEGTDPDYRILRKYTWGLDMSGQYGNPSEFGIHGAGNIGGLLACVETNHEGNPDEGQYWFFYDANGNVTQVIYQNGSIKAHYEYDPYGNIINDLSGYSYAEDNPFQFSTKWLDDELAVASQTGAVGETGLYYYGYRYYSPGLGIWLSQDPLEELGGFNLYAFVNNAVTNDVDMLGLTAIGFPEIPPWIGEWKKTWIGKAIIAKFAFWVHQRILANGSFYLDGLAAKSEIEYFPEGQCASPDTLKTLVKYKIEQVYSVFRMDVAVLGTYDYYGWYRNDHIKWYACCRPKGSGVLTSDTGLKYKPGYPYIANRSSYLMATFEDEVHLLERTRTYRCCLP